MLPKMRYRLGLDMGTNSIGWCMLRLGADDTPRAVIRMGVRIFPDGRNPKDGSSLAVSRREARQMRRRRDRLLKRKNRLLDTLVRLGFFPENAEERRDLVHLDPYLIRRKGLDVSLNPAEFARAVFHLNQRRGFLSNRKTDKRDSESGALKTAISELRGRLASENCRTLGEWLARRHELRQSVRARLRGRTKKERAYDFYADRAMIEHEFDTLWSAQSRFQPGLYTEERRRVVKDVLLFQRPLRPVKPGRCTLIPGEERAPLAMPSTQRFRIYQEVNHLRVITPDLVERQLSLTERDLIAGMLSGRRKLTFPKIRTSLGLPAGTSFNLEDVKRDHLQGNATAAILSHESCFGETWNAFDDTRQDEIVLQLLNEASESALVDWLTTQTGVDEEHAVHIAGTALPEGYGSLSLKALNRINPMLRAEVVTYAEAVKRAGFDSHSALGHSERTGEIMDRLPYYGEALQRHVAFAKENPTNDEERYGKIPNPTVHIALNELRKVVNGLLARYGHASEIVVEVTRDLKLGREKKLEIQKDQKARQDRNDRYLAEACQVLRIDPHVLDGSRRRELLQKMQLWNDLNPRDAADRRCPYTGEQISITRLLSPEVEVDHILPFSKTLDDSLNNKTVALRRANRDKGNRTPFEAFGAPSSPDYAYDQILARATAMPKEKAKRFAADGYERWLREDKDFLARALNDTAYISRIAREYLSLICPGNVIAIPGRLTAMLRGKYGLDSLLAPGGGKNRNDHRHHAIDAAVVAVTDRSLLQKFARASASAREMVLGRLVEAMPEPWPGFRDHVGRAVQHIVVSHKPDHGYQGAMHEETAWGLLPDGQVTRREPTEDGSHKVRIKRKQQVIPIASTRDEHRHGLDPDGTPKPYKGYVGGSNYCLEIVKTAKGRWDGEVVSTFDAYQIVRTLGPTAGIERLRAPGTSRRGSPLLMRLMINDSLQIQDGDRKRIMRITSIRADGRVSLVDHQESNVDARNRDAGDPFSYLVKKPSSLQLAKARPITISPIGDISTKLMAHA